MKEELITIKLAELVKKIGYNLECDVYTNLNNIWKHEWEGLYLQKELHSVGHTSIKRWLEMIDHGEDIYQTKKDLEEDNDDVVGSKEDIVIYPALTQSLLQKWLREEHGINIEVMYDCHNVSNCKFEYDILDMKISYYYPSDDNFETYEKALEAALQQETLKLIK